MRRDPTKKKQEKWVREGWQRYTTYMHKKTLKTLQDFAKETQQPFLEVLDDAIRRYCKIKGLD